MDKEFFRKLYEKSERNRLSNEQNNTSTKKQEKFGTAKIFFDEDMIEDIQYQFFLLFYAMIKDLPNADTELIISYIDFPEVTKIKLLTKLTENKILALVDIAVEIAMDYFTKHYLEAHSDFMNEFIEEGRFYTLCELSRQGNIFELSKDGREVFNHKVRLHSRFADERMKFENTAGAEIKWTDSWGKKAVKRMNELKDILTKCKNLFPEESSSAKRAKKIVKEVPFLQPYVKKIKYMISEETKYTLSDAASEILMEELNVLYGSKLKSPEYLKRRVSSFEKYLEEKAA